MILGGGGGACLQGGWGRGPHVFFGEAGFRVVSGLVARPTSYITSWLPLLYLLNN